MPVTLDRRDGCAMREGTIIVTGASRGIGAAIARDLDQRGCKVAGLSRGGTTAAGTGYACDMADEAAVRDTVARIAAAGPIIGLVNNAGVYSETRSAELTVAAFEQMMRVNVTAVLVGCREAYPHLVQAGGGLIVNIGSFYDRLGVSRGLAYSATKAAVGAMTRCLAVEWARDNIRVLDVAPGYIETDMNREALKQDFMQAYIKRRIPLRRPGSAEEVARLVGMLFEADIGFLTGETIYLDGAHGINHQ
jgi:NAD(P)-dependent dehydrogenase (short-subunit alcohol dehydrogenase family)